jgi:anti-sigma factor RsiW
MAEAEAETEHTAFENDFSDYYDGTLEAGRRAALEAHLASCSRCRGEYEKLREAVAQVALLGRAAAPRDLDDRVARTIHRRSAGRFFGRRAFGDRVPFELLAVVALAVLTGIFFFLRWSS